MRSRWTDVGQGRRYAVGGDLQLADAILDLAGETNMHVAARCFRIGVPRMSDLRHGRIARFSVERLIRILATVDRRVEVRVMANSLRPIDWHPKLAQPCVVAGVV